MDTCLTFKLSGSSHDRRKQYRKILRDFPDHIIKKLSDRVMTKVLDGIRVTVEDANAPQTLVTVRKKES